MERIAISSWFQKVSDKASKIRQVAVCGQATIGAVLVNRRTLQVNVANAGTKSLVHALKIAPIRRVSLLIATAVTMIVHTTLLVVYRRIKINAQIAFSFAIVKANGQEKNALFQARIFQSIAPN